jgi:hypothetical protein
MEDDPGLLEDYNDLGRSLCQAFKEGLIRWEKVADMAALLGHGRGDAQQWLARYRAEKQGLPLPLLRKNEARRRRRSRSRKAC